MRASQASHNQGWRTGQASQGFLAKYFLSVQLLLTLDICLILFLKVLKVTTPWKLECYEQAKRSTFTCCKKKIIKLEIAIFASSFTFPLLFDWIPFTTNSYGSTEANVCWFRNQNCSQQTSCTATLWGYLLCNSYSTVPGISGSKQTELEGVARGRDFFYYSHKIPGHLCYKL